MRERKKQLSTDSRGLSGRTINLVRGRKTLERKLGALLVRDVSRHMFQNLSLCESL